MTKARLTLLALCLIPLAAMCGYHHLRALVKPNALAPDQAIHHLTVPEGFSIDLVASEPDLIHPVAMTFDERGRIWVVTQTGVSEQVRGPDCVKVLESTRGDGQFDKVWTFTTGLHMAPGIAIGHGGVWVADAPRLLFYPFDPATGTTGAPQTVVSGFGHKNSNGLPNSLTWGPDGWLYGLSSVWSPSLISHQGKTHRFSGAMFRLHPQTHAFEIFAHGTSNPWGLAWDSEGSAFISTCVTDHLWHVVETGCYHRLTGAYPAFTWPLASIVNHQHEGHSHCGLVYFDGDAYPPEYRDRLYMGNVSRGAINVDRLERAGSTYRGLPAPDFLASSDQWFTPVAQKVGPDGCLYVLDWYDSRHCEEDMLRKPRSSAQPLGRLYRIRYRGSPPAGVFDLAQESDGRLLDRLGSANVYFRETAQRILAERHCEPRLQTVVQDAKAPRKSRMHALWALISAGPLEHEFHDWLLRHDDPDFRAWGVRAAGNYGDVPSSIRQRIEYLAKDPAPEVRLQVAIAATKVVGIDPLTVLTDVARATGDDLLLPGIVWGNLLPLLDKRAGDFLALVQLRDGHSSACLCQIVPRFTEYLAARPTRDPLQLIAVLQLLTQQKKIDYDLAHPMFESLTEKMQSGEMDERWRGAIRDWAKPALAPMLADPENQLHLEAAFLAATLKEPGGVEAAHRAFTSAKQSEAFRLRALAALVVSGDPSLLDSVNRILEKRSDSERFRGRMLAALGRLDDPRVASIVLLRYGELEPGVRIQAVDLLIQRPGWAKLLLQQIKDGKLPVAALSPVQVRQLLASKDADLLRQVREQWGTIRLERDPGREQVVENMKAYLHEKGGDPVAGKQVFHNFCGQCHKIHGEGADVGPDLTTTGRTSFEQLVNKVFNPNQFIRSGYQPMTAVTKSGRTLAGLVVEDNPQRLVLKTRGNEKVVIPRLEIEEAFLDKQSLMPEGIEKQLSPAELANLFGFLCLERPGELNGRKIPGAPP